MASDDSLAEGNRSTDNDIQIVICGVKFYCNKELLSDNSSYFNAMFNSQMIESRADNIELKDVSVESFSHLMRWLKEGSLELTMDLVYDLLPLACMLHVQDVIKQCEEYSLQKINDENCLNISHLADLYSQNRLYNSAKKHALWFFDRVRHSKQFLELSQEELIDYLENKYLNTQAEYNIFQAVVSWIEYEPQRQENTNELFSVIKLDCLTLEELQNIASHKLTTCNSEYGNKLEQYLESQENKDERKKVCPRQVPRSLYIFGAECWYPEKNETIHHPQWILRYDIETNTTERVSQLPVVYRGSVQGYKVCIVGKDVYLTGGETRIGRGDLIKEIWKYDCLINTWKHVSTISKPRRHHSLLVWGLHIYFVGGFGSFRVMLDSVDRLSTQTGEWTSLPALPGAVYSAAVAECRGRIYVIKDSVWCWAQGQSVWTTVTDPLPFQIGIHWAASRDDKIYLGGTFYKELYEYDPKDKTVKTLHNFEMATGQLAAIGSKLFRMGTEYGSCELLEWYDFDKEQFGKVDDMGFQLKKSGLLSVPHMSDFKS